MNNSEWKKLGTAHHIGPGGMNCTCCGPAPGKERHRFLRAAKRRERRVMKQRLQEELRELYEESN